MIETTTTKGTSVNHPLTPDQITEENYKSIADELFFEQAAHTAGYLESIATSKSYSDDDTDYLRTALLASERLMDLSYDGLRDHLVDFLFNPRDDSRNRDDYLADILSAGGLCDSLHAYEELIYAKEDENAVR